MRKTPSSACIRALLLTCMAQEVHAAHPLVTDDTSTQGRGRHQVELNSDWSRFAGEKGHVAALTYSYGATDALDLYGNLPASISAPSGRGDASLGAKWRFWQSERTSLALKPELFFPTGDEARGLGNGRASLAMVLLGSHVSGPWAFHGNIGFSANRYKVPPFTDPRRLFAWRVSAAVTYALSPQWTLVADTGVARNLEKAETTDPAYLLLGAIYSPRKNVDIDVGVKTGLNKAEVDQQVGAGLTIRF